MLKPSHFLIACCCLLLSACSQNTEPKLTLHVFECGNIEVKDISIFSPGVDEGKTKFLTNSCYRIQHEKGTMIGIQAYRMHLKVKAAKPLAVNYYSPSLTRFLNNSVKLM